jgi:hypothetical protein
MEVGLNMRGADGAGLRSRTLLILLTMYALLMIVPDLGRIVRPLGSFGLATNGDGLIYDVRAPFALDADSPAWRAGIRAGDHLDLAAMRCIPLSTEVCGSMLALWGGLNYVMPGRPATLYIAGSAGHPARRIALVAVQRPRSRVLDLVLVLDQIAGILIVLGAAWLVWIRPGGMTWGFFAYAIQFNPGQAFQFYGWLQLYPPALAVQEVGSCILEAAGYTGFLLFALRVPLDRADGPWRRLERALPAFAVLFFVLALVSLGSAFGYRTELAMRAAVLLGFAVDAAALGILIGRRRDLAPREYQRIRWVIWGCVIGLPAFLIAELSQVTSLPTSLSGTGAVSDDVFGMLYLVNGVLCLFVVEAVRRPTVVSVAIPLRRATLLGLLLSVPALFLHRQVDALDELIALPGWAWILVASGFAFLISRLHEMATELADRLFDRKLRRAEIRLGIVGQMIQRAGSVDEIERLLVDEPARALGLASAALFREQDGTFHRRASTGWSSASADVLDGTGPLLAGRSSGAPFPLDIAAVVDVQLPDDLARPLLAVPVSNPRRCFAVVLYGGHVIGTDLDGRERRMLGRLARNAEIAYAQVESETLHKRIAELEGRLARSAVGV